ncbi:ATPase/histidine kinase/DNA gyrase B/HSP90 domain protein [Anopheles sinensis]|uniref:ATPase/histidine kinase/DNA gyrase B/HSP90 domain protein n=1 Tax=Anopheles sinensis TaxID=74873 RepID=A0A084WPS5_ANOSI|nr:ATPase/histidine kinase/DNA gyrase B/HSP90 domain protein [Anopheles sinensis]
MQSDATHVCVCVRVRGKGKGGEGWGGVLPTILATPARPVVRMEASRAGASHLQGKSLPLCRNVAIKTTTTTPAVRMHLNDARHNVDRCRNRVGSSEEVKDQSAIARETPTKYVSSNLFQAQRREGHSSPAILLGQENLPEIQGFGSESTTAGFEGFGLTLITDGGDF